MKTASSDEELAFKQKERDISQQLGRTSVAVMYSICMNFERFSTLDVTCRHGISLCFLG